LVLFQLWLLIALFLMLKPAEAWNDTGHRVIAAIAYQNLRPQTRWQVDPFNATNVLKRGWLSAFSTSRGLA
jgi:hypothetical protein